jgi:hypothetical protein
VTSRSAALSLSMVEAAGCADRVDLVDVEGLRSGG